MSKELVISASSHERRVAILEEGQLVEIYIEREKEFALVGSIYKGKVTRVLPGMQSAFVDIGLDGDAFLYVSDVFENLEDYDHGHEHASSSPPSAPEGTPIEVLPGESLAHASGASRESFDGEDLRTEEPRSAAGHASDEGEFAPEPGNAHPASAESGRDAEEEIPHTYDERQPESNASAPQNFGPSYNPTQKYPSRQDRGSERGNDFRRGGRGRWGRRGGRRHGRGQGGPGGRNLPPSKYASPQGDRDQRGNEGRYEHRGYQNRGQSRGNFDRHDRSDRGGYDQRGNENRRPEGSRTAGAASEEEILLPGESLAKYRGRPAAAPLASIEEDIHDVQPPATEEIAPRGGPVSPGPRRFSGGLPRWLLADAGSETAAEEGSAPETSSAAGAEAEARRDSELSEDQIAALSGIVEAKHEETQDRAKADTLVGGAEFEGLEARDRFALTHDGETQEDEEEESENGALELGEEEEIEQEAAELQAEEGDEGRDEAHESQDEPGEDEGDEDDQEEPSAAELAEEEADAAHEQAEQIAALGEQTGGEGERLDTAGASSEPSFDDDSILLPGETRAPRTPGVREEFASSARIGGNPRSRFQRPFRGRDRGGRRDNRGGHRDDRGGRPDRRGGRRFDRRGPGGHGHHYRGHHGGHAGPPRRPQLISEMLKAGQDVVVQIAKEPLGKKGARITSHVALPGRFLVYMPTIDHIGVSRKIASAENRSRLRRLVGEARGSYPGGFIVRTAAGGATDDEIRADIDFLGKTWNEIKQKFEDRKAPALLHRDLNLVERILRDYVSDDFTGIWIDSEEEYGKVLEFVSRFQPRLANRVKLYTKEQPIFEEFGIQHELDKALRAKVWLKSGGYIVINHTEALVAIDVNTGKFVGKGSTRLEDTIVKTNLEAVKEIVRQIRLRDLGGIIVVDFIDMEERRNREKVLQALQQALEQDKAPSKALSFNEFGLVCITRKRTKQALERVLCQPCPYCTGSGMVKSVPTLCYEIQAEARKMATSAEHESPNLTLRVHPEIAKALKTRESMLIDELEQNSHKHVIIQSDATLHWEQYDIY